MKRIIKGNKSLYKIYTDIRYRNHAKVRNWILNNQQFIKDNNLVPFLISKDEAFIRVFDDIEFLYVPEQMGGLLGLEKANGFEMCEISHVLKIVHDKATVLDVGSNFGLYSVILAKKKLYVSVHCFEPAPTTFSILNRNISHNRLKERIVANNCGVAEQNTTMYLTSDRYAGNYLVTGGGSKESVVQVPVVTIDSYVEKMRLEKVDFIKCDIEGAELMMLRGAEKTLERDCPSIFLEISEEWTHRFGYKASDVFDFLLQRGYRYEFFTNDGVLISDSSDFARDVKRSNNFFFHVKVY